MTEKQREILLIIDEYIKKEGISPTVRELCDITGLKFTSTVHGYIKRLQKEGYRFSKEHENSKRALRII